MEGQQLSNSKMRHERGAALVVSLVILLIMTIISVTALRSTSMDEKMTSNTRQRQIAFNAAETALRAAETWLVDNINNRSDIAANFTGASGTGRYSALIDNAVFSKFAPATWDVQDDTNWNNANSVEVRTIPMLNNRFPVGSTPGAPRYRIEYVGQFGEGGTPLTYNEGIPQITEFAFEITAIGWGLETNARYLLTSSFRMQL